MLRLFGMDWRYRVEEWVFQWHIVEVLICFPRSCEVDGFELRRSWQAPAPISFDKRILHLEAIGIDLVYRRIQVECGIGVLVIWM